MKPSDQDFDSMSNDFVMWRLSGNELLGSRNILARSREKSEAAWLAGESDGEPSTSFTLWVELMLVGFALENFFKALWIAKGNNPAQGGKLAFPADFTRHDLAKMATASGFVHSKRESFVLGVLSNAMTGPGRYPGGRSSAADLGCWVDKHDDHVLAMLKRVKTEIFAAGGE